MGEIPAISFSKILLSLILLLISINFVSAISVSNFTFAIPHLAPGYNSLTRSGVFNVSIVDGSAVCGCENYTRAQVYIQGFSTTNTTIALLNDSLGSNTNQSRNFTLTINTSLLEDGSDYILTVNLWNGTNYFNATNQTITIDNGVPVAATSLIPTDVSVDTDGTINFTATVTDANTTTCYLNFTFVNPGSPSYAATYSTTSCSFQIASIPEQSYRWFITASDGTNATVSSTQTVSVSIKTGTGSTLSPEQVAELNRQQALRTGVISLTKDKKGRMNGTTITIIIIIIILGFILFNRRR